jgi:hypothetical protein
MIITGGSAVSRVGAGGRNYSVINDPPLTNRREDEWGGDFARRTRFPLDGVRAFREGAQAAHSLLETAN